MKKLIFLILIIIITSCRTGNPVANRFGKYRGDKCWSFKNNHNYQKKFFHQKYTFDVNSPIR